MALLEASRVGHDRVMEAFDPCRLVDVAAQTERHRIRREKRSQATAASRETDEGAVPDTPGRDVRDQDDPRCLPDLRSITSLLSQLPWTARIRCENRSMQAMISAASARVFPRVRSPRDVKNPLDKARKACYLKANFLEGQV
jgi:hypothetical protein